MPRIERFIIAAAPSLLRPLLDILAADPEVAVISIVNDRRNDPERLVVAMDPFRATALGNALGDRVTIEPDIPVNPI